MVSSRSSRSSRQRNEATSTENDVDREVREALAVALGERRRQLLVIYVAVIMLAVAVLWYFHVQQDTVQNAQRASDHDRAAFEIVAVHNCHANQANARALATLIDKLVIAYKKSPALPAKVRADRAAFFASGRPTVPKCPTLSPAALTLQRDYAADHRAG